ncbi:MAG: Dabb family protein [Actinobacteria bacterium]|nr:Dabb family protein [Actinomycetota bacterium]
MFRHVVTFRWNDRSTPAQRTQLASALAALPAAIPTIRAYHVGTDAGINEGNFDFAVVADFDDVDGYLVYRDHPAHTQVITELIAPYIDTRAAVQYDTGD